MPTDLIELTADEIGDGTWVEVTIKPPSLQDQMTQSQIARTLREPGVDGKPQMADVDINRIVFKHDHPEELARNIEMQLFEAQDPEVQQIKQAALGKAWRDSNKEMVKVAERAMSLTDDEAFAKLKRELTPEKLEAMLAKARMEQQAKLQGIPPEQFIQGIAAQAAGQDEAARQAALLPASVAPPPSAGSGQPPAGPPTSVLPAQMMMPPGAQTQAQMGVNPAQQIAEQIRRRGPVNKPTRFGP